MANPVNVPSLYSELNKFIHISDYKQALKAANKIIHSKDGKEEVEAMQCKLVCLIQMSQFGEALKFVEATPEIQKKAIFEKAYCHYRLLQSEAALEAIGEEPNPDLRTLELKAQILYKLGNYADCLVIYKQLMKECADDYEDERLTNLSAVHAALSAFHGYETEMAFEVESFEQLYNKACLLLGRSKVQEAQDMLAKAEAACRELYADDPDMTEAEIESEVAVIKVQLAYALQLQGKTDEAVKIYNQVIRSRPTDVALVAVASNNIISINKEQNVFDSRKKMKATTASGVEKKLVSFQKKKIDFNRALLLMYSNQWEACRKLLKQIHREHRDDATPCLIQAAVLCREKNAAKAVEYLESYIASNSDPDLAPQVDLTNIKLALVQMTLQQGKMLKCCEVLETMDELCHTPAVVSFLVSIYDQHVQNGPRNAMDLFHRAIEWHKANQSASSVLTQLMWHSSQYSLKHNQPEDAARTLESMLRLDPDNVKVMAQLIFAYSQFNQEKAHQMSDRLPSMSELSVQVDVDELERNASRLAPRYIKRQKDKKDATPAAGGGEPAKVNTGKHVVSERSGADVVKLKKKKKKKNPTPKNFQPNFVPDPERWMPLRDRSYYKGRRKDRKKGISKGSQGTFSSASEHYDMSKPGGSASASQQQAPSLPSNSTGSTPINSPKPTSSRASTSSSASGQPPKGKKAAAKKKKKGKGGW